eukprot:COSAG06_NODE_8478_length_2157_cov_4.721631_1_plen_38_part_10
MFDVDTAPSGQVIRTGAVSLLPSGTITHALFCDWKPLT